VSGLGVNEDTGDVVLPADRRMPAEFTVRSALPAYDGETLATAVAPAARAATSAPLPHRLTSLATRIAGNENGYPALRRLTQYFRSPGSVAGPGGTGVDFRVDLTPRAPGGHGIYQINRLLDTGSGTAEQYASTFAVLARALGYEARVVMGFRPRRSGPDAYTVTGKDVHAWAEVRFAALGWVPFDPTPVTSTTDAARPAPPPPGQALGPAGEDDRSTPAAKGANQAHGHTRRAGADRGGGTAGFALLALTAGGGPLVVYVSVVPAAKSARQRRRRRHGGPGRRTIAAWRDTVDRLVEARVDVVPADTSGEVVAAARRRFGERVGAPVRRLALLHDEAAFAPGPLAEPMAETAWRHAEQARREIRAMSPPLRRLLAALSPRALAPRRSTPRRWAPRRSALRRWAPRRSATRRVAGR
jgi:hypothetical protein